MGFSWWQSATSPLDVTGSLHGAALFRHRLIFVAFRRQTSTISAETGCINHKCCPERQLWELMPAEWLSLQRTESLLSSYQSHLFFSFCGKRRSHSWYVVALRVVCCSFKPQQSTLHKRNVTSWRFSANAKPTKVWSSNDSSCQDYWSQRKARFFWENGDRRESLRWVF